MNLITNTKITDHTHRVIGEIVLQHYGKFLEKYSEDLREFKTKLSNSFDIKALPLILESTPVEDISLLDLIRSDNKLLSKLLVSIASLCEEISLLVTEAKDNYYTPLISYDEEARNVKDNLHIISGLLDTLQRIHLFIDRSGKVISLLLKQICAILGQGFYASNSSSFPEPLECLAQLLVVLLTLGDLLQLSTLKENFALYRRAVRATLHNTGKFGVNVEDLKSLELQLSDIERVLFSGNVFKTMIDKYFDEQLMVSLSKSSLHNELTSFINQMLQDLERDDENVCFTQIWLEVNAIFVFKYYMYGDFEKKLCKRLLEVNKKTSACTLFGNIVWYPEHFLVKHIPFLEKQLDFKALRNFRLAQITQRSQNLPKETQQLCLQACEWALNIGALNKQNVNELDAKTLQTKCNLLIEGVKLAKKISELVKWIMNLHADEERPMTMSVLLALCKLIEILKIFQFTFHRNISTLVYVMLLVRQQLTHKALSLIHSFKKNLMLEKSYKEQQLDVLSALSLAEYTLNGPNTRQRILVAKLALSASGLSYEHLIELRSVITRLELICYVHTLFIKLCDCSFLYWHEALLPAYFSKLVQSKVDLTRFYIFLAAVSDCASVSKEKFNVFTHNHLKNHLLGPLNQLVETNLRLQTHSHLQLPSSDPFNNVQPLCFKKLIPARLSDNYVSIKNDVEHYLSNMFYNLITVVLHDWKTYGEMRRLAFLQYNLSTVDDCLPMQTLEQGLDVLEIMRNIHVFVGKYLYNLNNQVFVEEWSNNKHLNTINISHVANSIRTHGIGIMNTTVNFTYQFLQNKFYIFSQFMYDEHIKSRLLKDLRYFIDHKAELNHMYPYEKAEKFNTAIKKLGLNEKGLSYLDLFRKLITQIGNAMGYVRLIRSGGRRCLAEGTCFIPDLKDVNTLAEQIENYEHDNLIKKTLECLQRDLKSLVENFEEATEYFKLLVQVFAPALRNAQNMHLRNFYVIVPPLTINFVEHSLMCKEKLNKKNREGAAFTDDGFAMGLAYIIELLEQHKSLNSIHWFHSIRNKYAQDKRKLKEQKASASKDDQKLQQTLSLAEKRIDAFNREFQLLFYNYNSARIFFQSS